MAGSHSPQPSSSSSVASTDHSSSLLSAASTSTSPSQTALPVVAVAGDDDDWRSGVHLRKGWEFLDIDCSDKNGLGPYSTAKPTSTPPSSRTPNDARTSLASTVRGDDPIESFFDLAPSPTATPTVDDTSVSAPHLDTEAVHVGRGGNGRESAGNDGPSPLSKRPSPFPSSPQPIPDFDSLVPETAPAFLPPTPVNSWASRAEQPKRASASPGAFTSPPRSASSSPAKLPLPLSSSSPTISASASPGGLSTTSITATTAHHGRSFSAAPALSLTSPPPPPPPPPPPSRPHKPAWLKSKPSSGRNKSIDASSELAAAARFSVPLAAGTAVPPRLPPRNKSTGHHHQPQIQPHLVQAEFVPSPTSSASSSPRKPPPPLSRGGGPGGAVSAVAGGLKGRLAAFGQLAQGVYNEGNAYLTGATTAASSSASASNGASGQRQSASNSSGGGGGLHHALFAVPGTAVRQFNQGWRAVNGAGGGAGKSSSTTAATASSKEADGLTTSFGIVKYDPSWIVTPGSHGGGKVFGRDAAEVGWAYPVAPASKAEWGKIVEDPRARACLPALVVRCVAYLETWAPLEEGIFRISGRSTHVQRLRAQLDTGADLDLSLSDPAELDPHAVASVFKAYLRELPSGSSSSNSASASHGVSSSGGGALLTPALAPAFDALLRRRTGSPARDAGFGAQAGPRPVEEVEEANGATTVTKKRPTLVREVAELVAQLRGAHWWLLRVVIELLAHTAHFSDRNKMSVPNLLVVFCPSLGLSPPFLRLLVENHAELFPPFPPTDQPVSPSAPSTTTSFFAPVTSSPPLPSAQLPPIERHSPLLSPFSVPLSPPISPPPPSPQQPLLRNQQVFPPLIAATTASSSLSSSSSSSSSSSPAPPPSAWLASSSAAAVKQQRRLHLSSTSSPATLGTIASASQPPSNSHFGTPIADRFKSITPPTFMFHRRTSDEDRPATTSTTRGLFGHHLPEKIHPNGRGGGNPPGKVRDVVRIFEGA